MSGRKRRLSAFERSWAQTRGPTTRVVVLTTAPRIEGWTRIHARRWKAVKDVGTAYIMYKVANSLKKIENIKRHRVLDILLWPAATNNNRQRPDKDSKQDELHALSIHYSDLPIHHIYNTSSTFHSVSTFRSILFRSRSVSASRLWIACIISYSALHLQHSFLDLQ